MRKFLTLALSVVVILGLSPFAQGAGFLIYEHGAAAMAMGGAFVGLANDTSAIFHNPAGIAWLKGTQISVGTTLIRPDASLSLPNWPDPTYQTVEQEAQWFYPSTFYLTYELTDKIVGGFGFFTPYGLGTEWPEDYPLKYISVSNDMKTFVFNPTVAYKVTDNLSIGVGVSYIYSTLDFELVQLLEVIPGVFTLDVPVTLDATGNGWGFNAGALYKGENYSLGFNWRSGFKIKYDGDLELDLSQVPLSPVASLAGTAATEFSFPHIFGLGLALNLTENLIITADIHYVLWSSFDEFVVEVDVPGIEAIYPPGLDDKVVEENWEDSFTVRGGLQYEFSGGFTLRAGAAYDQTPQPVESMDPILPDANRIALTAGFGYKTSSFFLDVAYQAELFSDRTSPNRDIYLMGPVNLGQGTYSTTAHLFAMSLGFVF